MPYCVNIVRDVVKMGEGYGVSSYYLDEGAQDCLVERNVSVGVERPIHNHIVSDVIVRDNVFIAETNMTLSFPRSRRWGSSRCRERKSHSTSGSTVPRTAYGAVLKARRQRTGVLTRP